MLVLTTKVHNPIFLYLHGELLGKVEITHLDYDGKRVRVGFDFPKEVVIRRNELPYDEESVREPAI